MYNVLIVDDEPFVREGLKSLIDWRSLGFAVCGEAESGEEALPALHALQPDIVVTDIQMPFIDGLELIRITQRRMEQPPKFVIISGYNEFSYAKSAIQYQVRNYILKPIDEDELIQTLLRLKDEIDTERLQPPRTDHPAVDEFKGAAAQVEQFLRVHYTRDLTLKEAAEELYMNPVYLGQLFRRAYGMSFHTYLNRLRIDEAKRLLIRTDKKVYEVAEEIGFNSPYYFARVFEKLSGLSPTEYRHSYNGCRHERGGS